MGLDLKPHRRQQKREALVGDWGFGNLEDDDALDYVDELTGKIAADLDRAAAKRRLTADEVLTRCMPRLAVLAVLNRGVPMTAGLTTGQLADRKSVV